jgi:hypothetical protein
VAADSKDYGFRGFFELRTPQDLMRKLEHDLERLRINPLDTYAAFDFFVTANHLVDWIWPSSSRAQLRANRREDALPRICEHLADGAKHFLLANPHQGVVATQRIPAAVYGEAEYGVSAFAMPASLQVHLEPDEAAVLGCEVIDVLELATRVLEYWQRRGVR